MLLTERKEHLDILANSLQSDEKHLIVLSGRLSAKERRTAMGVTAICSDAVTPSRRKPLF